MARTPIAGREDDLRALLDRGLNAYDAARELGLNETENLRRWCSRNGFTDLYHRFPQKGCPHRWRRKDEPPFPLIVAKGPGTVNI